MKNLLIILIINILCMPSITYGCGLIISYPPSFDLNFDHFNIYEMVDLSVKWIGVIGLYSLFVFMFDYFIKKNSMFVNKYRSVLL